jgi:hypothetical protein
MPGLIAFAAAALWVAPAAQAATFDVNPAAPHGWSALQSGSATAGFELGPSGPPLGTGSAEFRVGASSSEQDVAEFRNSSHNGVSVAAITRLDYWTFVNQRSPASCIGPYLTLNVDVNGDGAFVPGAPDDVLNFEPCYQTGGYPTQPPGQTIGSQCPSGPVVCFSDGVWNQWNAHSGGWWSTFYGGAGGPPLTGLTQYRETLAGLGHGDPRIAPGGLRVRVSAGPPVWNNFEGNVDALTIGVNGADTTYDFESFPNPVEGSSHNLFLVNGTALVKQPGGPFVPLVDPSQITDGSIVNAENGKVRMVSAFNRRLQSVRLFGGRFRVRQPRGRRPIVVLTLLGKIAGCRRGGQSSVASRHRRGRRHLFGSGSGSYRTSGNRGAATVTGTKWLTADLCGGRTLFKVRRGVIKINDFSLPGRVNKVLRAGQKYIAKP